MLELRLTVLDYDFCYFSHLKSLIVSDSRIYSRSISKYYEIGEVFEEMKFNNDTSVDGIVNCFRPSNICNVYDVNFYYFRGY